MTDPFPGHRPGASAALPQRGPDASLTYEPFFGLREKPFSLSADPRFLYKSPSHGPVFDTLFAAIRRREGLIALTGKIGTGKTTLCRGVLRSLDRRTFTSFIPDPFVSREDLLKMLLVDFGVISVGDLKQGRLNGASRPDLSYPLYEFLDSLVPLQAFAVLVIDEAQHLPLPLLEEIRILSELERREKLLQVVLVGQPELRASLRTPEMRQVDQRVSVRCELTPLDAAGVAGYVRHRLAVASAGGSRVEFTAEALDAVYRGSAGVPRLINRICDRALEHACAARSLRIEPPFVWKAIDDVGAIPVERPAAVAAPRPPATEPHPPISEAPAPLATVIENASPRPAESVRQAAPFVYRAPDRRAPSGHPWIAVAVATVLALAASGGGGLWYLRAQTVDRAAVLALLPPSPPPTLFADGIAPRTTDAALASDVSPAGGAAIAPSTPASEPNFLIQVASFESRARAQRLVDELAAMGYRAREVELDLGPPRGRLLQVVIGGYASALDVERDLRQIRALPGYSDAHLLNP